MQSLEGPVLGIQETPSKGFHFLFFYFLFLFFHSFGVDIFEFLSSRKESGLVCCVFIRCVSLT